eukprot:scaffold1959_cov403-Prasinococcus_capsulatus_cf.AAC.10
MSHSRSRALAAGQVGPEVRSSFGMRDSVDRMQMEIADLSRIIEQGGGVDGEGEETMDELLRQKEDLIMERDAQVEQIVKLRNDVMEVHERLKTAESERTQLESEITALKESVAGTVGVVNVRTRRSELRPCEWKHRQTGRKRARDKAQGEAGKGNEGTEGYPRCQEC